MYWFVIEAFKGLGVAALILIVLQVFAKNFIKSWFEKDLEAHKASLKQRAELEMTEVRANNDRLLADYREKISHLSRERMDAIKGVSQRLIDVWAALEAITAVFKPPLEDGKTDEDIYREEFAKLLDSSNEFLRFLKNVEIFFPEELSDRMFRFRVSMNAIYVGWVGVMPRYMPEETRNNQLEALRRKKEEYTPAFNGIRTSLRELLGVA